MHEHGDARSRVLDLKLGLASAPSLAGAMWRRAPPSRAGRVWCQRRKRQRIEESHHTKSTRDHFLHDVSTEN